MPFLDTIGQHILLFVIDEQMSNAIVVDVISYQPPYINHPFTDNLCLMFDR